MRGQPAAGETGIGEHGGAALGATDAQDLGGGAEGIAVQLGDALLLRAMDGEQAVVDLGVVARGDIALRSARPGPTARVPARPGRRGSGRAGGRGACR